MTKVRYIYRLLGQFVVSVVLLPAAGARWRGQPRHGEAPAPELPPEPVQALHPDPQPQPLHLVQDGPETLARPVARFRQAGETSLAPLLHNCVRIFGFIYIRIRSVTVMAESHRRSMELASEMYNLVTTASCRRRRYSLAASRSGRPPSVPPAAPASGSGRGSGCTAMRHTTAAISHPRYGSNGNGRGRVGGRWLPVAGEP